MVPDMDIRDAAEQLLRRLTGDAAATFRRGQWDAIEALVVHRRRVLVVQRTGWGKSAVYFVATRLLRDQGAGPTVLVSPLLALMRNQVQMAERAGVRAATINSANRDDWDVIEQRVSSGEIDLLLISPERLNNPRFRAEVLPALVDRIGLIAVDEAHCISDWGHDFRPDYRRIRRVLALLPRGAPVLCTTATANDRVIQDIVAQLGEELTVLRGPLHRDTLALGVVDLPDPAERLAWMATVIPHLEGSGIVYCLTVADTERVAEWLRRRGLSAIAYSGESDPAVREPIEADLLANRVKVVVATSALGMGFDKPDLAFVIHYQSPGSPIAYYQQVGRAGRGIPNSIGVLLRGTEDADIQDYFIRTAFPPKAQAEQLIALLEAADHPLSLGEIEASVNARHSRLEAMLKVLEVEGAVERGAGGWRRTLQTWSYDTARVGQVTALRRAEQAAMQDYAATPGCRMAFLRHLLDDPGAAPCGRCDRCSGRRFQAVFDPELVAHARAHLRSIPLGIEPRLQWPRGSERSGRIPLREQVQPGRALCVYGNGGWGRTVKAAKYQRHTCPDELVDALVALVQGWDPQPSPGWVTCVPSTAGVLVPDLAHRLAAALGVPFLDAVRRARPGSPQKDMENSVQQFSNVYRAFEVPIPVPHEPVLLVDDIVDSRWTLTVVGSVLRQAGGGEVHPLVLAKAVST